MLTPDEGLDDYLRQAAHLPERTGDYISNTPPEEYEETGDNTAARNIEDDSKNALQDEGLDGEED